MLINGLLQESLDVFGLLTNQGSGDRYRANAAYILRGIWFLSCVTFIGTYSSRILVMTLSNTYRTQFTDVQSLANCLTAMKCRVVTRTLSNSYFGRVFNAKEGDKFWSLRKALEKNKPVLLDGSPSDYDAIVSARDRYVHQNVVIRAENAFF